MGSWICFLIMNYVKMRNILIILFAILILSCDEIWLDTGDTTEREIELNEFKDIFINDIFNVYLSQDTVYKAVIKGGSKIISNVELNQDGHILNINYNKTEWLSEYNRINITIHFVDIDDITLTEPSNLYSNDTIKTESILVHALAEYSDLDLIVNVSNFHFANSESSGGVYNIKGKTDKFTCWVRGSGILQAENLRVQSIYLRNSSIGNCFVNAITDLTVKFENSGLVYYSGNPLIVIETPEFSDQLIKME